MMQATTQHIPSRQLVIISWQSFLCRMSSTLFFHTTELDGIKSELHSNMCWRFDTGGAHLHYASKQKAFNMIDCIYKAQ